MEYTTPSEWVMQQLDEIAREITEYHQAKREHRYARALACLNQANWIKSQIIDTSDWVEYIKRGGK